METRFEDFRTENKERPLHCFERSLFPFLASLAHLLSLSPPLTDDEDKHGVPLSTGGPPQVVTLL